MANISYNWPGTVWLFSDPHFGDKGILKYERSEFNTVEEANDKIISMINSQLTENDTLVCLGDLGVDWENQLKRIKKCAKKVLVMGNHDGSSKKKYKQYFDEVYSGPIFATKFVVLSHEPIPVSNHFLNVHGHLHNAILSSDNHLNLAYKCNNYKLYNLENAHKRAGNFPKIKAHFLEEWYADKYQFINETGKFIPRNCFYYSDTGEIITKSAVEHLFKLAKSYIITQKFVKGDEYRYGPNTAIERFKKEFDEFYANPENRNIEIKLEGFEDAKISRLLFDNFVIKNNYTKEFLLEPDIMYGIIWFYTPFSGRCKCETPVLIKLKKYYGCKFYPILILAGNDTTKKFQVKLHTSNNEGCFMSSWQIEDRYFDSHIDLIPSLDKWKNDLQFYEYETTYNSELTGQPLPIFKTKLFTAETDELALLEYEVNLKQERPF